MPITNQPVLERFFDKVDLDEETGCWDFVSSISRTGYGRFYYNGRARDAYRFLYILLGGEIPEKYDLHHICENTRCVNPEHLLPVSKATHHGDLTPTCVGYKNKRKTHCPQGHPYTEENLVQGNIKGRVCKICMKAQNVVYREEKRREEKESRERMANI